MKKNIVLLCVSIFIFLTNLNAQCIVTATADASGCNQFSNIYSVSGTVSFVNPPSSGTMTIINSCGGSQVFSAPFISPITYSFGGLNSDGQNCNVVTTFSTNSACYASAMYLAPEYCYSSLCSLTGVANPEACDPVTNTYGVSGSFSFIDPPTSGSLIITNSCGGNIILPGPFVSPVTYNFPGMPANGDTCIVNARFSAISTCYYNSMYVAPTSCETASVDEKVLSFNSNIAPNPSNGSINISLEQTHFQSLSIDMVDVLGRSVYYQTTPKFVGTFNKIVDLTSFDKGIYFVRITGENGSEIRKIIYQ